MRRAVLIGPLLMSMGVLLGRSDTVGSTPAIVTSSACAAVLLVAIVTETIRGASGPLIPAELTRLGTELAALREHIGELETLVVILKSSIDTLLRRDAPGAAPKSSGNSGNFPAIREP